MVEYLSPNTNKPLHLGHVRNGCIGMSVARLLSLDGNTVIKANLVNDRGIHICKTMLAWLKWSEGQTPESTDTKGDHFVGDLYVRFSQESEHDPTLMEQAEEMLRQWEAGDQETRELWRRMNSWVYEGFASSYSLLGFEFDKFYYESNTYLLGRDIVNQGLTQGVFENIDGTIAVMLPESFGLEKDGARKKSTLLRRDGTSLYITQDIGTAVRKAEEWQLDRSIYVVGSEQEHHFNCLFYILKALGFEWSRGCYHLSYGMVNLPEGKMKSREGKVVDADNLVSEMKQLALAEIEVRQREQLECEDRDELARKIALAAIKFFLLDQSARNTIKFDPTASLSFTGRTGPCCLYAITRAKSVVEKSSTLDLPNPDYSLLTSEEETMLLRTIADYPEAIQTAVDACDPSEVAGALYDVVQTFNEFHQRVSILSAECPSLIASRLNLTKATLQVIRNGLWVLGIEEVDAM
jgi:arginyl-tRNA synthetase